MRATALLLIAALAACSTPGSVRNMTHGVNLRGYHSYSWGKAGVSFSDYREAVFQCTSAGVLTHVMPDPQFGLDPNAPIEQIIVMAAQLEQAQHRDELRQRHEIIDNCLSTLGFRRFGLTDDQLAQLDTLPRGSEERQRFLYELGSSASVLRRQHLES